MTTFLLVLVLAAVATLVLTFRELRHDHPTAVPRSHADWTGGGLPSRPYSVR